MAQQLQHNSAVKYLILTGQKLLIKFLLARLKQWFSYKLYINVFNLEIIYTGTCILDALDKQSIIVDILKFLEGDDYLECFE